MVAKLITNTQLKIEVLLMAGGYFPGSNAAAHGHAAPWAYSIPPGGLFLKIGRGAGSKT